MVGHDDHVSNDHVLVLGDDREHGPHHHQAADQEQGGHAHHLLF